MTTGNSPTQFVSVIGENLQDSPRFVELSQEVTTNIEKSADEHNKRSLILKFCWQWLITYVSKFRGLKERRPKPYPCHEYIWASVGVFLSILAVSFIHFRVLQPLKLSFLIGSVGASAAIVFGVPHSPAAQPRNLISSHIIGAFTGCVVRLLVYQFEESVGCAVAATITIVITYFTETAHPPAVATALIAVTVQPVMRWANFQFVLMPTLTGTSTILVIGLIVNNLASKRTYPSYWW